jgi:predicted  nucleic acid-binding Zn-ribbon protein
MTLSPASTRARLADLALITYLGPIVEGRRVAVVGPTSGEVARRARVLGARTVISLGGVGEDIAVRALTPGTLAGMHGRLDVVVVPDAGAVPSLVAVLDEARRALGSDGVVVVASLPEGGAVPLEPGAKPSLGYYDLEELCAARFARVRMFGRGPFLGYTLAALDEGSAEVSLDTRLLDGDPPPPEAFIAVASDHDVALDPLTIVQLPPEALQGVRAAATQALEEELARQGQKLKEVEAASAERWVKIQRFEHGVKELEEENRKARDKAVRLSKELEDERKLRQRLELEAQMARRTPELPKPPDLTPEVKRLEAEVSRLEHELSRARAAEAAAAARAAEAHDALRAAETSRSVREVTHAEEMAEATRALAEAKAAEAAARARIEDLSRELDETQAAEAELRRQLDDALERMERLDQTPRIQALEAELDALRRGAVIDGEYDRLERSLAEQSAALQTLQTERDNLAQSVRELTLALEAARNSTLEEELATLRSRMNAAASVHAALAEKAEALAAENDLLRERIARASEDTENKAKELTTRVEELHRELEEARRQAEAARVEKEHLHAQNVGLEARLVHTTMELEGARAGYLRRVAELEREIERLVRALEVSAAQSQFDREATIAALERDVADARAERDGLAWRVREAEASIQKLLTQTTALRQEVVRLGAHAAELEAKNRVSADDDTVLQQGNRVEALIADLSATAERLARTEEELAQTRADGAARAIALQTELDAARSVATNRIAQLEAELTEARAEASRARAEADTGVLRAELDRLVQERDRKAADVEALLAQIADRDLRLAALERRREDELGAIQRSLTLEAQANRTLRTTLEAVRSGLSAILVDGRGATVAHDLMALLRRIEET